MLYDIIVIGSGPGGYAAAIRAAQLGLKPVIVECAETGGVCLNRGCIPTKTLLKSASTLENIKHSENYGIIVTDYKPDVEKIVARARNVSETMSKGVDFLLKKNKIDLIKGFGKIKSENTVEIDGNREITASHIIIATGARPRELPSLPIDEKYVISYKTALFPAKIPKSMLIVGSGAIGVEMAYFYNSMGTEVTIAEFMPNILPLEDEDVSNQLSRSLRKSGIKLMTSANVESCVVSENRCTAGISTKKGCETIVCDQILSAVGVVANIENIGIENLGIAIEKGKIKTDNYCCTSHTGIYAIGDVIATPALAHVASAEAITCVEKIAGLEIAPVDYTCIPSCIYTVPETASVGLTEKAAKEAGLSVKTGKFPLTASGKAASAGNRDGFVKLVFDEKTDKLIGAHLVGLGVTEMIAELVMAKKNGITAREIADTAHPHPTVSEAIMEAAAAVHNKAIHL
ncbi:MAG: dihydrolipoyl dehydrogenase [Prevotellaceae bacterium]|nr:dihydrolipoyl dehydrogenase [Prevotellaceae bacterium]